MLLAAANAGDAGAYRRLLLQLTPILQAFTRRGLTGAVLAGTDAENTVQETLLAIYLKRESWDESAPVGPWIRAIAHHKLIDMLRRRGRWVRLPAGDFSEMLASEDEEPDRLIAGVDRHLESLYGGSQSATLLNVVRGASIGASVAPPDASCFDFRYSP